MAEVDGNLVQSAWSCYARYSQTTDDTSSTISMTGGMRSHGYGMDIRDITCVVDQGGYQKSGVQSFYSPYNTWTDKDFVTYSDTWTRTHEDRTINCWARIDRSSASYRPGTSTAWLTFTVPAKPHWSVSYDANGGSGAPGGQTKWYGETLTLSSTKPTRTGYTFQGWATSSSGGVSYQPGASYTSNSGLTLYAVWKANTWAVSYDANGGSGAPAAQTKTYGQTLTLSSTRPTRALYNFKGWATSASSTVVAYQPGASYTTNDSVTLYAVWELAYVRPRITGVSVGRCDKDGKASDEGTYCAVTFSWATDHDVQAVGVSTGVGSYDYKSSGRSGAVSAVIGDGELSIERSYDVEITVSDDLGQSSVTRQIAPFSFVMDFAPNGSVAIGTVANESKRQLDIAIPISMSGGASMPAEYLSGIVSPDLIPTANHVTRGISKFSREFATAADGTVSLARPVADETDSGEDSPGASGAIFSANEDGRSSTSIGDLDYALPGVWSYNRNTDNRPSDYGLCLVMWTQLDGSANSDWKFQIAFPTAGDPKWRRNVNRGGWSDWWTIPSS